MSFYGVQKQAQCGMKIPQLLHCTTESFLRTHRFLEGRFPVCFFSACWGCFSFIQKVQNYIWALWSILEKEKTIFRFAHIFRWSSKAAFCEFFRKFFEPPPSYPLFPVFTLIFETLSLTSIHKSICTFSELFLIEPEDLSLFSFSSLEIKLSLCLWVSVNLWVGRGGLLNVFAWLFSWKGLN